jgi:hypothetical protein
VKRHASRSLDKVFLPTCPPSLVIPVGEWVGKADAKVAFRRTKVALKRAYDIDSGHSDFQLEQYRIEKTRYDSEQRVTKYTDQPIVRELLRYIY